MIKKIIILCCFLTLAACQENVFDFPGHVALAKDIVHQEIGTAHISEINIYQFKKNYKIAISFDKINHNGVQRYIYTYDPFNPPEGRDSIKRDTQNIATPTAELQGYIYFEDALEIAKSHLDYDIEYYIHGRLVPNSLPNVPGKLVWIIDFQPEDMELRKTYWPYVYVDAINREVLGIANGFTGEFTSIR